MLIALPVQTRYDRMRAPAVKKAIWIVIDDPPGGDNEESLRDLKKALELQVTKIARSRIDETRSPRPACGVTAGVADSPKLRIYQQER